MSNPQCRHGVNADDCEKTCQACAHECGHHDQQGKEGGKCKCDECECPDWSEGT